jgi:chromosomal replication initiation ATPase DnaA
MENIKERIKKRALIIDKLTEKQNKDIDTLLSKGGKIPFKTVTKAKILSVVMKLHNLAPSEVFKKRGGKINRDRPNVEARQMYFWLCKNLTSEGLKEIGIMYFYNSVDHKYDHSTVIHGIKTWTDIMYQQDKRALTNKAIKILTV